MKISLNWLKDYVAIGNDPQKLAHRLTMAGLEVEKIENIDGDSIFELEITPNRSDCLNHLGIAREASAILTKPLKSPKFKKLKIPLKKADLSIDDQKGCPRYIGAVIENVSVKEAPRPIGERINSIGLRSVNNIVDITNFCLMEMGQPMHAFDFDKLIGGKIIVRKAKEGETIFTIDGIERKLDPSILIIADAKRPVAIAGIMGGKDTEVTEKTKNVLLESAYFDPILIRRAGRKLGLSTDASYRFERGVDMKGVLDGAFRALSLINEHAGGIFKSYTDVYPQKQKESKRQITISKDKIDSFLGAVIPFSKMKTILSQLGFGVGLSKKNFFKITAPSFRNDVKQDVDVVEEIARILGYDHLPISLPAIQATSIIQGKNRILRQILTEALVAQGLSEVISYSMINQEALIKSKQQFLPTLKVRNPLSKDQEIMRPSLLPSLLTLVATNVNRGQKDLAFFEAGKIYLPTGERETLGIIMTGNRDLDWRHTVKEKVDFYDIKGVVEQTLKKIGICDLQFTPLEKAADFNRRSLPLKADGGLMPPSAPLENLFLTGSAQTVRELNSLTGLTVCRESVFEEGQSSQILLENKTIGALGQVHQAVLKEWDIKQKGVFFAEIDAEALYSKAKAKECYQPIPEFPSITRDISLAVKEDVAFQQIKDIVQSHGASFLTSVDFLEQYLGEKIQPNQRGVIISLTYQSASRTLREDEVNSVHQDICQALVQELGAIQR